MFIIIDTLMNAVMKYFHIIEARLKDFTTSFIQYLSK